MTDEVAEWLARLNEDDPRTAVLVAAAINLLEEKGPALDRPLADKVKGSSLKKLKELRPGSSGRSEVRILFVFDTWRQAILLVAGDKSTDWKGWYRKALKDAERLYAEHVRAQEKIRQEQKLNQGQVPNGRPQVGRSKGRAVRRPRGRGSRR
jgi:hypothetical protein